MKTKFHLGTGRAYFVRSSHQRCSVKKVLLKNLQSSRENTCARVSFLIKLQASQHTVTPWYAHVHVKKRLWHRCFPVNFANFLRTPLLQNTFERLLLSFAADTVILLTFFIRSFTFSTHNEFYLTCAWPSFYFDCLLILGRSLGKQEGLENILNKTNYLGRWWWRNKKVFAWQKKNVKFILMSTSELHIIYLP